MQVTVDAPLPSSLLQRGGAPGAMQIPTYVLGMGGGQPRASSGYGMYGPGIATATARGVPPMSTLLGQPREWSRRPGKAEEVQVDIGCDPTC